MRVASAEMEDLDRPWQLPRRSAFLTWLMLILTPSAAFLSTPSHGEAAAIPVSQTSPLSAHGAHFSIVHANSLLACAFVSFLCFFFLRTCSLIFWQLVASILLLMVTVFMGLTSFTNPGLIARPTASVRRANHERYQLRREETPPFVIVEASGGCIEVPTKYCTVCGLVRPPRASHCRETDRCIERWDHFCPWVGTAVGLRNYRWFVLFVLSATGLALYIACASFAHLRYIAAVRLAAESLSTTAAAASAAEAAKVHSAAGGWPAWLRAALGAPLSCALVGYGVVVGAMLTVLSAYHLYLIGINQSTYEHVRGTYDERGSNPFDRGPIANCLACLCPGLRACAAPPCKPSAGIDDGHGGSGRGDDGDGGGGGGRDDLEAGEASWQPGGDSRAKQHLGRHLEEPSTTTTRRDARTTSTCSIRGGGGGVDASGLGDDGASVELSVVEER